MIFYTTNHKVHLQSLLDEARDGVYPTDPVDREFLGTYLDRYIELKEVWDNFKDDDLRKMRDALLGRKRV